MLKDNLIMRTIFLSLLLFLPILANAQVVRIPDAVFRGQLIALGYDTNDDGKIQVSEAKEVTNLDVKSLGIVNLEGINSFTNMKQLDVANNKIGKIDVSNLKKLEGLYAWDNPLTEVNVTGLTQLRNLMVNNNGGNYGLSRSFIKTLDVSTLVSLEDLRCQGNLLTKIDVSGLNKLDSLQCMKNNLESVSLRKAPNLRYVDLSNNPLQVTVDIRGLINLEYFDCKGCNLIYLNMSGTVKLKNLSW
jgi:protein phosphatase 1 regulatory subunit 7